MPLSSPRKRGSIRLVDSCFPGPESYLRPGLLLDSLHKLARCRRNDRSEPSNSNTCDSVFRIPLLMTVYGIRATEYGSSSGFPQQFKHLLLISLDSRLIERIDS